jgi:hypothetical protein
VIAGVLEGDEGFGLEGCGLVWGWMGLVKRSYTVVENTGLASGQGGEELEFHDLMQLTMFVRSDKKVINQESGELVPIPGNSVFGEYLVSNESCMYEAKNMSSYCIIPCPTIGALIKRDPEAKQEVDKETALFISTVYHNADTKNEQLSKGPTNRSLEMMRDSCGCVVISSWCRILQAEINHVLICSTFPIRKSLEIY